MFEQYFSVLINAAICALAPLREIAIQVMKLFFLFCTCLSIPASAQTIKTQPRKKDTIKDRDGNIYSVKLMPDNKWWMTDNLKTNIPNSYCYDEKKENYDQYGRLYSWESAQAGCKMLGEGWRLATNDEWQEMAKHYGGVRIDSINNGKAAYKALMKGGESRFNVVYGGGRTTDGQYARLDAHGFYWTATETNADLAWFYNLGKGGGFLNRHNDGEKSRAFAVRCVGDINNLKKNK